MGERNFTVKPNERGQTLAAVLKSRLAIPWSAARKIIEQGRVRLSNAICKDVARRVQAGQHIQVAEKDNRPTRPKPGRSRTDEPLPNIPVRYSDDHIVVVEKPPGLTTMRHAEEAEEFGERGRRFLPKTLADLLPRVLMDRKPVLAVHRIDRDTTGLVVFARTKEAERSLGKQFRAHSIERKYLALVRGRPAEGRIESKLVHDRGDGRRGSSTTGEGQRAVTLVRVVQELGPLTLVECALETGRTHQVRIHLGEAAAPLCGEKVYDRPLHGKPAPDPSDAKRVLLHAAYLGLDHPITGQRLQWFSPLPDDMAEVVERFRK